MGLTDFTTMAIKPCLSFAFLSTKKVGQEQRRFLAIPVSFSKNFGVGDLMKARRDVQRMVTIGLRNFLL